MATCRWGGGCVCPRLVDLSKHRGRRLPPLHTKWMGRLRRLSAHCRRPRAAPFLVERPSRATLALAQSPIRRPPASQHGASRYAVAPLPLPAPRARRAPAQTRSPCETGDRLAQIAVRQERASGKAREIQRSAIGTCGADSRGGRQGRWGWDRLPARRRRGWVNEGESRRAEVERPCCTRSTPSGRAGEVGRRRVRGDGEGGEKRQRRGVSVAGAWPLEGSGLPRVHFSKAGLVVAFRGWARSGCARGVAPNDFAHLHRALAPRPAPASPGPPHRTRRAPRSPHPAALPTAQRSGAGEGPAHPAASSGRGRQVTPAVPPSVPLTRPWSNPCVSVDSPKNSNPMLLTSSVVATAP